MFKICKCLIYFCLIICFSLPLTACNNKKSEDTLKATINDVNYSSLTDAVNNAKSGDTINLHNNVRDYKNVIITKPLKIKGVLSSNQTKPKFYGSLTINCNGENDSILIENIELIHSGTNPNGENNNTTIGINLVDGGIELKSNLISIEDQTLANPSASGLVISRKFNSINTMPIIVRGNRFDNYNSNSKDLSSALIIKSNKPEQYQNINLNEEQIFNQNTFSTSQEGNQFISINYQSQPYTYTYFATSSTKDFVDSLINHQNNNNCTIIFSPLSALENKTDEPLTINNKTYLIIEKNNPADMQGSILKLQGSIKVNGDLSNAVIEKTSPTASIMFNEESKKLNVEIK